MKDGHVSWGISHGEKLPLCKNRGDPMNQDKKQYTHKENAYGQSRNACL